MLEFCRGSTSDWCEKGRCRSACPGRLENEFLRFVDIRIDNFTKHTHLYKQPPSCLVKALKRIMEKSNSKYVFAPADNAANNVIII